MERDDVIDPEKLDGWQAVLLSGFSLLFLAMLVASVLLHVWVWSHRKWLLAWTGWETDRPKAWVGLIDLVLLFGCMFFVQSLVLSAVVVLFGLPLQIDSRVAPEKLAEIGWWGRFPPQGSSGVQESPVNDTGSLVEALPEGNEGVSQESSAEEIVVSGQGHDTAPSEEPTKLPTWLTPVLGVAMLLGGALSAVLVVFRTGATPIQLGVWSRRFLGDIWVGALVFLWATPIVLVQSQIVSRWTEVEYKHPVIDAMVDQPWMYPFLFFGAVLCAPLWEEYAFRALLIGWFDTLRLSGGAVHRIVFGQRRRDGGAGPPLDSPSAVEGGARVREREDEEHRAPDAELQDGGRGRDLGGADTALKGSDGLVYPPWWPAMLSGVVFGLAHWGYGVSWVPLITLGVVLGRVFQLRRSIVPCVVAHGLFNSLSMMGLAVEVFVRRG